MYACMQAHLCVCMHACSYVRLRAYDLRDGVSNLWRVFLV